MRNFFLQHWPVFFEEDPPEQFDLLPLTTSRNAFGNDLLLLFVRGATSPNYIFKICRDSRCNSKISREYDALVTLRRDAFVKQYLPNPLHFGYLHGRSFLIQSGIQGTTLGRLIQKNGLSLNVRRLIEKSLALLARITTVECIEEMPPHGNSANLELFEKVFAKAGLSTQYINKLLFYASEILDRPARSQMFVHGDFWPHNIIVDSSVKNVAGIIDWEFASKSIIPIDIAWFIINTAYNSGQRTRPNCSLEESFEHVFFSPEQSETDFFVSCYKKYICQIGQYDFAGLLGVTLAMLSIRELSVYGEAGSMDKVCMNMLRFLAKNNEKLNYKFLSVL